MAFKMRCPKCFGLDYSIERDNRTFGAVAQAFELVFHCRCGKQLFGEALLKEYDAQKKDYDTNGESALPRPTTRRPEDELGAQRRNAAVEGLLRRGFDPDDSDDDDDSRDREDDERLPQDKRWQQRMAAIAAGDGDDEEEEEDEETPIPASRARGRKVPSRAPVVARSVPPPPDADDEVTPSLAAHAEALDEADEDEDDDDDGDSTICAWPGCTNARRPNSKYCSRACSNKNARSRHKTRVKKPRVKKSGDDHVAV